jgi:hypothetical protein
MKKIFVFAVFVLSNLFINVQKLPLRFLCFGVEEA